MNSDSTMASRSKVNPFLAGTLFGAVIGAGITATYFHQQLLFTERRHRIDTNRAMARFLAWQTSDGQECSLPIHAYRAWFPFAHDLELEDGAKRYHWVNYSATSDRLGERADRVTGIAWMVLNSDETIREIKYASCD